MRFVFVVNPRAGRGPSVRLRRRLEREFPGHDVEIVEDVPPRSVLEAAIPKPVVVAVGGDGTVQRILRRVGTPFPCPLGLLPLGTANDLARASGIPEDFAEACSVLRAGRACGIDVLEVNGLPFVTSGGLGLPAAVAERADRLRASRLTGFVARACRRCVYAIAAGLELIGRPHPVFGRVENLDAGSGRPWSMITVSNEPLLGGFRPSPEADPRDGRLDVCAITAPRRRLRLAWLVWRMLRGRVAQCPESHHARTASLILHTTRPTAFLGDGEILCRSTRFEIRVRPAALPLVGVDRGRNDVAQTRDVPLQPPRRSTMKPHGQKAALPILLTLTALLLIGSGCEHDTALGPSNGAPFQPGYRDLPAGPDGSSPPPGLRTVSVGSEDLVLWPYTGAGFDGSPIDPVNVIFAGAVHPLQIRAALVSLNGDRSAFGIPPVPPFDARWTDIVGGGVQTTYTEGPLGWTGSVVQLTLGELGPLRVHLRLFTTGRTYGEAGTWTVGAAHFELLIPGTADHQVLSWEIARDIVVADLARSGLLDPSLPMVPSGPITDAPSWRTIPAIIYNGLPPELVALIDGPPQPVSEDVPIENDGSAMILNVVGTVPSEAGSWYQTATAVYDQIVPKPFCSSGPGDYLHVSGPVDFVSDVTVDADGKYVFHARYDGRLQATPVNLVAGDPVPVAAPLRVKVRGEQNGFLDETNGRIAAHDRRVVRGGGGPEMWISRLVVPETGRKTYSVREKCVDSSE